LLKDLVEVVIPMLLDLVQKLIQLFYLANNFMVG
jgi:hypothetical protein